MWESDAEAMSVAVRLHDNILRETIEKEHGYVFKTVGDAFCAGFAAAPDAVRAAVTIQQRLREQPWKLPRPIRVRIGLHTGEAEIRDDDYFGPTLNRVARLQSAAFGGQTILSLVTEELVRDYLPDGVSLASLGSHRLKDLTRPETVFELRIDAHDDSFPQLKSLDAHLHNLPLEPTPLIGREKELEPLEGEIRSGHFRLLTLVGPGGIGKTRMGLQIAADLIDSFPDGAFIVDLAPVRDPEQVPRAIALALKLRESAELSMGEHLKQWLATRTIMLILDNFEQVIEGGNYLATLLSSCANLRMIVTSRESLHLRGEHVFHVPPLALPSTDEAVAPSLERLSQYDAVRLFVDRAVDVKPSFKVTNENAPAIAAICVHLDGLPLALELAAARTSTLTPETLFKHLGQRLAILTGGPRDLPARQQTLRNTVDWSFELLSEIERKIFAHFSIFYGGFTVEAADAICEELGIGIGSILETTQSLVEKSLVASMPNPDGESRFYLLETMREYGRELLEKAGELLPLARKHADYYLRFAEEVGEQLEGASPQLSLARIDRDIENIRHAIHFFSAQKEAASAARLLIALGRYWQQRGYLSEARSQLEMIAASSDGVPIDLLARSGCWAAVLAREQGDYAAATLLLEGALDLSRRNGNREEEALALHEAGWNAQRKEDIESARRSFIECQKVAEECGDELMLAKARFGEATVDLFFGKTAGVRERLEQAGHTFHSRGHLRLETQVLGNLGLLEYQSGRYEEALAAWERLKAIYEEMRDNPGLSLVVNNLGEACVRSGRPQDALNHFEQLLNLAQQTRNPRLTARADFGRAEAQLVAGDHNEALESIGAAMRVLNGHGIESGIELGQCLRVRGDVLKAIGRGSDAAESYHRAVSLLADSVDADELRRAEEGLRSVTENR